MSLTLAQLETFARVAALGNFTRVAEERYLTQPAVTQQVRALERHFKVRLVDVVGHQPQLTDAGRFLANRIDSLLVGVESLERDMSEFVGARTGELHIGATLTIGTYALPSMLARFTQLYPDVHVQVEIANTTAIASHVQIGALNLALIEGENQEGALQSIPYQHDHLVLVVNPSHPFARRASITFADMADVPMIFREDGSGTRALIQQAFVEAGIIPRIILELPSGESILRAVEAGLGIAFLPYIVIKQAVTERRVVQVEVTGLCLSRMFQLVMRCGRTLSPTAEAFKELVFCEYLAQEFKNRMEYISIPPIVV